jgi:hypothetical protein
MRKNLSVDCDADTSLGIQADLNGSMFGSAED